MSKKTALHPQHIKHNAKLVDFAEWEMPLHYGSQIDEHNTVREHVGMFDVSHMAIIDLSGVGTKDFLRYVLANDVAKLKAGKALYTCMLNESGCVIDDLIVYYFSDRYRLVVNAGTFTKDYAWLEKQAEPFNVQLSYRDDLAMVAVQGPKARETVHQAIAKEFLAELSTLKPFGVVHLQEWLVARTGYTGEDGYEIMLPNKDAIEFWQQLVEAGAKPCGLGARDTLRLEAGLNLYGNDMNEDTHPFESGLGWTVALDEKRDFIGKDALLDVKATGVTQKLVGVVLTEKGVLRPHQVLYHNDQKVGELTSGTYSPTLGHAIGLARVRGDCEGQAEVEVRNKRLPVKLIKPPFVRHGKKHFE